MLSRRNIRVKVLQILYSLDRDPDLTAKEAEEAYIAKVGQSFQLYLQALYLIAKVCECAEYDHKSRKDKYLPTELDKNFSPILYQNEAIQSLVKNTGFQVFAKNGEFESLFDKDNFKLLYKEYAKTPEYQAYVMEKEHTLEHHIQAYHDLLYVLKNELLFHESLMDVNYNWIDDDSHVIGAIKRTFKAMPLEKNFYQEHRVPKDKVDEFGRMLLIKVIAKSKELDEIITEFLENWDLERLAIVDLLILKMGIAELLYFDSIPTHVTLNEYLEVAKEYSTEKSKEFINGVLDKAMKQLDEDGRINKRGRGKIK